MTDKDMMNVVETEVDTLPTLEQLFNDFDSIINDSPFNIDYTSDDTVVSSDDEGEGFYDDDNFDPFGELEKILSM